MPTQKKIQFIRKAEAQLLHEPIRIAPAKNEIAGRTLVSVVSSGSETGGYMDFFESVQYPVATGYAAVIEVTETGSDVNDYKPGDVVFAEAPHQLYQTVLAERAVKVPDTMPAEHAVLTRFPAISMTSLLETRIKPTEPAIVTGLGIVGLMCAQILKHCGYNVYTVDPSASRRDTAAACGIKHTAASLEELADLHGIFGLAMECSGNDHATIGLVHSIRKGGEIYLIGVPWKQTSDMAAHELFKAIFTGYVHLSSGWEWSLPRETKDFLPNSTNHSFQTAMRWIAGGALHVDGIYRLYSPGNCNAVYTAIAQGKLDTTCAIFDWRNEQ